MYGKSLTIKYILGLNGLCLWQNHNILIIFENKHLDFLHIPQTLFEHSNLLECFIKMLHHKYNTEWRKKLNLIKAIISLIASVKKIVLFMA